MNNYSFDDVAREKHMQEIRQRRAEQKKREHRQAVAFLFIFILVITGAVAYFISSGNDNTEKQNIQQSSSEEQADTKPKISSRKVEVKNGITYVDDILIVNKSYSLPSTYAPGFDPDAEKAFNQMAKAAKKDGIELFIFSAYRSYDEQKQIYDNYVVSRGETDTDRVSARPGFSEHQTGLAIDVNTTDFGFENTKEGKWLAKHCVEYGFIIRFPEGKSEFTDFDYEPWHIRYLGVETAKKVDESGLCLEEYLGVTSQYDK